MNVTLWIVRGLLAFTFIAFGGMKLFAYGPDPKSFAYTFDRYDVLRYLKHRLREHQMSSPHAEHRARGLCRDIARKRRASASRPGSRPRA